MANRLATLLGNTKTRTMVLLVAGVLILGVVIAVSQTGKAKEDDSPDRTSKTTEVPNQVKSTPGEKVSRKYQELQEQANIRGAKEAAAEGKTFIPTLTGNADGYSDSDFEKQLSQAFDDLGGKCSKETVAALRKEGMDNTQIIMELKSYGCSAAAIASLFNPDELAAALLAADCGVSVKGCSTAEAKKLKDAGYDATKIAAAFKKNGCNATQIAKSLKENGSNPTEIAAALKEAGSNPTEIATALKETGSTPAEIATALKANGATIEEIATALKVNGVDATQVASALAKAGFSKAEILPALAKAGFNSLEVAKAMSALDLEGADSAAMLAQQQARDAEAQRLAAQQEAQQLAAFSQQRQAKIQELVAAMDGQQKDIMETWTQIPEQAMVQGQWATDRDKAREDAGISTGKDSGAGKDKKIILKAGSILFAVLDTAVNSDEPGPVMATVVAGSLKGSKLMGTMTTNTDAEKLSLNFTAINMPNEPKSMGISAVAIDPDTARTALASDVDHHYLLRWGSLFAASFMEGYASAVANAGTTSSVAQGAAGSVTTTTTPGLNGREQLFSGLAAVGSKWSEVVGRNFDRPITITIDQGTGIGVLLTGDLTYGTDPEFYNPKATSAAGAGVLASAPGGAAGALPQAGGTSLTADQTTALINALQNKPAQVATSTTVNAPTGTTTTTTTSGGK